MASTNSWTHEIESPVAAPRLFRAAVMDWHTLAPKIASHIVASAHPVDGDGSVGSVRQFNFTSGIYIYIYRRPLSSIFHHPRDALDSAVARGVWFQL
jgi:hypothetical protein